MIALVASGGGGGGDSEVRFTVPWCETIARKEPAEVPGHVLRRMLKIACMFRASGHGVERLRERRGAGYLDAMSSGKASLGDIVQFELCFRLVDELCILEKS